jgi:quinolinate synthase
LVPSNCGQAAKNVEWEVNAFRGVHFMAETAIILILERTAAIPRRSEYARG